MPSSFHIDLKDCPLNTMLIARVTPAHYDREITGFLYRTTDENLQTHQRGCYRMREIKPMLINVNGVPVMLILVTVHLTGYVVWINYYKNKNVMDCLDGLAEQDALFFSFVGDSETYDIFAPNDYKEYFTRCASFVRSAPKLPDLTYETAKMKLFMRYSMDDLFDGTLEHPRFFLQRFFNKIHLQRLPE